jgi:hypothetical protein
MAKTVVGVFRTVNDAEAVVRELQNSGFNSQDISLLTKDTRRGQEARRETGLEDVKEGAAAGAGIGAVLGGGAGLLVGLGALTIPGIGPIIAAGPLAAALGGAGLGAAAGGIAGALVDMGIPERDADQYAEAVSHGGTLVSVRAEDRRAEAVAAIMERYDPVDTRRGKAAWDDLESRDWALEHTSKHEMDYDRLEPQFRQHYSRTFSQTGRPFEDYHSAYRYGYRLHQRLDCNGDCNWDEVRPEARRDWERTYPGTPWLDVESAVRHGFEQPHH